MSQDMGSLDYFNDIAEEWGKMRKSFFSDEVRKIAIAKAAVEKGKIAADIGAGTGFITEELLRNGVKVIAVDQSEEMINILKETFENEIVAIMGNSDSLPLKDNAVDYTFANMYLHHVENPLIAIKEMVRILNHKGKLIITDLDTHDFQFLKTEQYDIWMGFNRDDIKNWFEEAGLKNVTVECLGEDCCADSDCGCNSAKISIFIAYGEKI